MKSPLIHFVSHELSAACTVSGRQIAEQVQRIFHPLVPPHMVGEPTPENLVKRRVVGPGSLVRRLNQLFVRAAA
jgi:hypothetical protein